MEIKCSEENKIIKCIANNKRFHIIPINTEYLTSSYFYRYYYDFYRGTLGDKPFKEIKYSEIFDNLNDKLYLSILKDEMPSIKIGEYDFFLVCKGNFNSIEHVVVNVKKNEESVNMEYSNTNCDIVYYRSAIEGGIWRFGICNNRSDRQKLEYIRGIENSDIVDIGLQDFINKNYHGLINIGENNEYLYSLLCNQRMDKKIFDSRMNITNEPIFRVFNKYSSDEYDDKFLDNLIILPHGDEYEKEFLEKYNRIYFNKRIFEHIRSFDTIIERFYKVRSSLIKERNGLAIANVKIQKSNLESKGKIEENENRIKRTDEKVLIIDTILISLEAKKRHLEELKKRTGDYKSNLELNNFLNKVIVDYNIQLPILSSNDFPEEHQSLNTLIYVIEHSWGHKIWSFYEAISNMMKTYFTYENDTEIGQTSAHLENDKVFIYNIYHTVDIKSIKTDQKYTIMYCDYRYPEYNSVLLNVLPIDVKVNQYGMYDKIIKTGPYISKIFELYKKYPLDYEIRHRYEDYVFLGDILNKLWPLHKMKKK